MFEELDSDSFDEDAHRNWQKQINLNIKRDDHDAPKEGVITHDVFGDYKDKFLSGDAMEIDISTVDIFSYARHGRIN